MFGITDKSFSKEDSLIILKSLRALMGLGNSLFEAVILQQEIETGKNAKLLSIIISAVKKQNKTIEKLLLQFKIIGASEYLVLKYSKDTKESLEFILRIRSVSRNFNKTVISLFLFPIIALFVGLSIAKFLLPVISKPINELIAVAKIKNGIDVEDTLNIPSAFFYIHHPQSVDFLAGGVILLIIGTIFLFKYFEKNNPSLIYKLFPLKSYDDIPYIFILMRALNKGGLDLYSITNILYKSNISKGWKIFFLRLKKQIENNKEIYKVFQEFGFPKQIYIIIKTSEKSKSFWESFDGMINYAEEINVIKNKEIVDRYSGAAKLIGYVLVIFFLIGILLLMFSMQNIVMAMQ